MTLAVLERAWRRSGSMLCVGLDPSPGRLPAHLGDGETAIFEFCRQVVDATADVVCAFKPQFAHFAAQRAEPALERLCRYIRERYPEVLLILDAKRGDIGSTAEHYATEAFVRYGAHAVTVNPYLGTDAIEPFLRHEGHGVFVLCRTSNAGGDDLQALGVGGEPLHLRVARLVAERWSQLGECGLVVGATYPGELAAVRAVVGDLPILVPGAGTQGGDVAASVAAGRRGDGWGLAVNSSRGITEASGGPDFAEAARAAALGLRAQIDAASAASSA